MNSERMVFRPSSRFLLVWFFTATLCMAWVTALVTNVCRQHGRHLGAVLSYMLTRGLVLELIYCGVFAALFAFLLARFFPVEVTTAGINGHNAMGSRMSIRWQEVEMVRPFSLLGLKYLRIYPHAPGKPLWVPLFLEEKNGFRAALQRFAPVGNPVLKGAFF